MKPRSTLATASEANLAFHASTARIRQHFKPGCDGCLKHTAEEVSNILKDRYFVVTE